MSAAVQPWKVTRWLIGPIPGGQTQVTPNHTLRRMRTFLCPDLLHSHALSFDNKPYVDVRANAIIGAKSRSASPLAGDHSVVVESVKNFRQEHACILFKTTADI
jgi:hypothetical protein